MTINPEIIKLKIFIHAIACLQSFLSTAQADSPLIDRMQYGATIKAKLELRQLIHDEPDLCFSVAVGGGVAGKWMVEELYPSVNGELKIYNGGFGSDSRPFNRKVTLEGVLAITLTTGRPNISFHSKNDDLDRYVPLQYFADYALPALQNPYNYSFSLGTNFIFATDRMTQRLGFANILLGETVQVSYYNDGTPFQLINAGDYKDRYYTGGGKIIYSHKRGPLTAFDSWIGEVSYQKFTGYSQDAFELGTSLGVSNVDYKDGEQQYYNKSLWKFGGRTINEDGFGFGASLAFYNYTYYDVQHYIHTKIRNAYHIVPYAGNVTIDPSAYYLINSFKNK